MHPAILYGQIHLEHLFVFACCYLKLCGHFGGFCKLVSKAHVPKVWSNPDYGYHRYMHNLMAFPNIMALLQRLHTRCFPEHHSLIAVFCTLIGRNATLQYPALRKLYIFEPTAQFLYFFVLTQCYVSTIKCLFCSFAAFNYCVCHSER